MTDRTESTTDPVLLVVIDGPAGAGKTTVARQLAQALRLPLLDTGAIYRTLALAAARAEVPWNDEPALVDLAQAFPIEFSQRDGAAQRVLFGGDDVSEAIRTHKISDGASEVSAHPGVRAALLGIQRALGAAGCVAEGRDMGTVVFPHAPHKFYVTADLDTRAARRRAQLVAAGGEGPIPSLEEVSADIDARDTRDSSRATAPLAQADDALLVDTTAMAVDAVVALLLSRVRG